jgi:hypothetical protein
LGRRPRSFISRITEIGFLVQCSVPQSTRGDRLIKYLLEPLSYARVSSKVFYCFVTISYTPKTRNIVTAITTFYSKSCATRLFPDPQVTSRIIWFYPGCPKSILSFTATQLGHLESAHGRSNALAYPTIPEWSHLNAYDYIKLSSTVQCER